ncbi:MAG: RNA polymerase sigma factor [Planctomycetes bacterium]|nr:RNA polymerase sigma factor [Planctomycetota bacterium]
MSEPRDASTTTSGDAARRFEVAFTEVAPALFAWAELRIRPQLRVRLEPQDLVQEVWVRGMRSFARFDERESSFRAWIFRIGKNVMLEALRTLGRESNTPQNWSPTTKLLALEGLPQSVTSITQRLSRDESVRAFVTHVEGLEEEEKMVLLLCGLEEKSCAEAGQTLGIGEEAVMKRWQRLRDRLRSAPFARVILRDERA